MNRGKGGPIKRDVRHQGGYTIVEVLIFLAVSAVLFGSTMTLLAGRQQKAQFNYAVRDLEIRLQDVANDVSSGYYSAGEGITCDAGQTIADGGGSATLGTNKECILLGRVVKFGDLEPEKMGIYSLVGRRTFGASDVRQLADASPTLLWNKSDPTLNEKLRDVVEVGYGAKIVCVYVGAYAAGKCNPNSNGGIAFVTNLSGTVEAGASGGAISSTVYHYPTVKIGETSDDFADRSPSLVDTNSSPVSICLQSGATNQYAIVKLINGRIISEVKEFNGSPSCS